MEGGGGSDVLNGGLGADDIYGGSGGDGFYFSVLETSANRDIIEDFDHAEGDFLAIYSSQFSALASVSGNYLSANPQTFVLGTAATTGQQRIIYDQASGSMWYDDDGVGAHAKVLVATFANNAAVVAGDIFIL